MHIRTDKQYKASLYSLPFLGRANEPIVQNGAESGQAFLRPLAATVIAIYVFVVWSAGELPATFAITFAYVWAVFIPAGIFMMVWALKKPEPMMKRRVLAIGMDFGGTSWLLVEGGPTMLPAFALLLWIVVGNGLRFGPRTLLVVTVLAFVVVLAAAAENAYWEQAPYLVVTFLATIVMVPMYVFVLLDRLQRAYDAAREANLSKSRFLAQASHDLRQPIHAISLYTACLRDAELQPKELQMVDSIDNSLESVARLFKSLLDISTLDSGRVTPKPEAVPVAAILDDVVKQNREAARRSGGSLRYVRCSQVVSVDRALVTTMLQNIINNAIKYAPGEEILIGCRRRAGKLSVVVYDRGPGIAQEHHELVFEEFFQVRSRGDRDVEGVGLGLSIVRRLAQLQGLQVQLRSEVGRGTCVTLGGLPVVETFDHDAQTAPESMKLSTSIDGLRVLLVEDDESVLLATASLLTKWGCVVQAETAIPTKVAPCTLLITDYDLGGGVTGTDCIRFVRNKFSHDIPAVVMTGHDVARVREDLGEPRIPILAKPVRPAELRSVILGITIGSPAIDRTPDWWR